MKWYHWSEKEPEDNQFILVYHDPVFNDPALISVVIYKKYDDYDPTKMDPNDRIGWTYWCDYNDIPLPIQSEKQ